MINKLSGLAEQLLELTTRIRETLAADVTISSYGFKYGEPFPDAQMRIDLRNRISNPQDHLPKGAVGTDRIVHKAVLGNDRNKKIFASYLARAKKLVKKESSVSIAFGCTSGIHRSVVFAEELAKKLGALRHSIEIVHVHLRTET